MPFLWDMNQLPQSPRILDIGCGTGVATVQLAQLFPQGRVLGIDLSPVPEHTLAMAPKNVTFLEGNILEEQDVQDLSDGSLDYVFGRMLFLAIDDWPGYFSRVHRLLKPGAIVEHQDCSWEYYRCGTSRKLSGGWKWHRAVLEESQAVGLDICVGDHLQKHMEGACFEVLRKETFEFSMVPSKNNLSSMKVGNYVQNTLLKAFPDLLKRILGGKGRYSDDQVSELIDECLKTSSAEEGIFVKYTVMIGRKLF